MKWRLTFLLTVLSTACICGMADAKVKNKASTKVIAQLEEPPVLATSPWSVGFNYGVSTDLAAIETPRLYYQGLGINLNYMINPRWSLTSSLNASFTTIDGQIDKRQEESALESSGVNPSLGLNYSSELGAPWFLGTSVTALLDTASQREGYLGLATMNGGGVWTFFKDRLSMTHSLAVSELFNTYDYSSGGGSNPGTWFIYTWSNSLKVAEFLSLGTSFGFKQTRYLDGYWDYSYATTFSATLMRQAWSMSLALNNGGYTEDGHVSFWYIDQYRRLISLSMAYQF